MFKSSRNDNIQFSDLAQYSEVSNPATFDETFFNAFVAAKNCAEKNATDKTTRGEFKAIEKLIVSAKHDPRVQLSSNQQALIRRWYLKSLEN